MFVYPPVTTHFCLPVFFARAVRLVWSDRYREKWQDPVGNLSVRVRARLWPALAAIGAVAIALTGIGASGGNAGSADIAASAEVPVASEAAPTAVSAAALYTSTQLPGFLHTVGADIRTSGNKTYVIKAISWFGLETSNCAPHGLWTIRLQDGLAQIKSMGFNTIRLPFSNECLDGAEPNSINYAKNPSLVGKSAQQIMDFFVDSAAKAGLNVILDRHRPGSDAQSELWYTAKYSEAKWISRWEALAKRYKSKSNVIGFDLHNEPHGSACWGCGTKATDWRAAATRAGNAVLKVNSKVLIIVEGVEKQPDASFTWWGGGLAGAKAKPVSLTVKNRVVYSPHEYPASVFAQDWFSAANYPANLPGIWDKNWGYLDKKNIAPVLVGEFGTKLETSSDKKWLKSFVSYVANNRISFSYWSFNPNSGDTGGIVRDDWVTPQKAKLAYLEPLLGKGSAVVTPAPDPTSDPSAPTAAPTAAPTPTTPTAPGTGSTGSDAVVTATWLLQSAWAEGYVAEVVLTSKSGAKSWSVTWPDTKATGIASAWGMDCTVKKGVSITCSGVDYGAAVLAGQKTRAGLQVLSTKAPASPQLTVTSTR